MIRFEGVGKRYGGRRVVDALDLAIDAGEFVVLIGPSGSGKSTTLKMINRLVEHDEGRILFAGEEIRRHAPEQLRRRMGYAIQSIGLFPHWTVARNIATVPVLLGWPSERVAARVRELMELLGLPPAQFSARWPHELSGGQQQRVGVARAMAANPEVLLMDEPFGALDPVTRASLQDEMVRLHRGSGRTVVMVTHDLDEALHLATRVVMLDHGRIAYDGTPDALLRQPPGSAPATFVGGAAAGGLKLLGLHRVADCRLRAEPAPGEPVSRDTPLREFVSRCVAAGTDRLPVADDEGRIIGSVHLADVPAATALREGGA